MADHGLTPEPSSAQTLEDKMFVLSQFKSLVLRLHRNEFGAVATEYAFLIAFIAIVAALGMVLLGQNLSLNGETQD